MNICKHPNCNQLIKPEYELCYYHFDEMIHNGEAGHWDCDWCKDYKEAMNTEPNLVDWENLDKDEQADAERYL